MSILAAALAVVGATILPALPAAAAPVYEITAQWAEEPPATVASGDVLNAEWRVNVNDDAAAPSNEPVDNVTFTLTLENGTFDEIPASCLVDGVTPASSISEAGRPSSATSARRTRARHTSCRRRSSWRVRPDRR